MPPGYANEYRGFSIYCKYCKKLIKYVELYDHMLKIEVEPHQCKPVMAPDKCICSNKGPDCPEC